MGARAAGRLAALAGAAALVLATAPAAAACSCVPQKPKAQLKRADAAFNGRLVSVEDVGPFKAVFRYRVGQVFKGRGRLHRGEVVGVRSASNEGACGLPRETGVLYGLFVDRSGGRWHGNLCNLTSPARLRRAAGRSGQAAFSTTMAIPCPTPMHMVARPS
jgi:hypothetical protein